MKQIIFDYLCRLADDPASPVTNDDAWPAHQYVYEHFDYSDIYPQIDVLIKEYFANK